MNARTVLVGVGAAALLATLGGASAQAAPAQVTAGTQVAAAAPTAAWPDSRCSSTTTRGGGYLQTYWTPSAPGVIQVRSAPSITFAGKTYKRVALNRTAGKKGTVWVLGGLNRLFGPATGTFTYLPAKLNMRGTQTVITVEYDSGHKVKCLVNNWHPKPAGRR